MKKHRIGYHEKHRGQLFCTESAELIIEMLKDECAAGDVHWRMPCKIASVEQTDGVYILETDTGTIEADALVIATGGLSIPKIGATDFSYRIASQFGLRMVEPRPALVPLTFDPQAWAPFAELSGIALEVEVETGALKGRNPTGARFREDLLFTHRGLSGPAILQISSYWIPGTPIVIDLLPGIDVAATLIEGKGTIKKQLEIGRAHV